MLAGKAEYITQITHFGGATDFSPVSLVDQFSLDWIGAFPHAVDTRKVGSRGLHPFGRPPALVLWCLDVSSLLWMVAKSISHHFETMAETMACSGFLRWCRIPSIRNMGLFRGL